MSKTLENFISGLNILSTCMEDDLQTTYFCFAEHDEIFFAVSTDDLTEDSTLGKFLGALGFHTSEGSWAWFT